jgi:hypothetical protein
MLKGIIGGAIAGLLGAAVWAAIAYYTGYEIGWIAWGIGAFVGLIASKAMGRPGGVPMGVAAAVIAVVAIAAGKYGTVYAFTQDLVAFANRPITDEVLQVVMATDLANEQEAAGKSLSWPQGMDADSAEKPADFPTAIWQETQDNWNKLQESDRQSMRDARDKRQADMRAKLPAVRWNIFKKTFGAFDLLFIGLALMSAFRIGSGAHLPTPQPITPTNDPPATI